MIPVIFIWCLEALILLSRTTVSLIFYSKESLELYKLIENAELWLFIVVLIEIIFMSIVEFLVRQKVHNID